MQRHNLNNANPLHPEREIANRNRDERNQAIRTAILGYMIPLICITVPLGAFVYDLTRPSENAIFSKRVEVLAKRVEQLESENERLRINVGKMENSFTNLAAEFSSSRAEKDGGLKFLKFVPLESSLMSMTHWRDQTFVGLHNKKIASIDSSYRVNPSFITFNNFPLAIEVYDGRLYTLVYGGPWTIYVHDMQGNLVNSWNHTDIQYLVSGLAIVAEQLVVPDRTNKYLHIYSLSGSLIKSVSCPQLSQDKVSLCALGADSVIVSDWGSSQVFRMNISSGEVMWTCNGIVRPEAVTSYGQRYIIVAAQGSSTLRVLDSATGKIVSELTDNAMSGNYIFDMCITGDTLIVANSDTQTVLYYQLLMA